MHLKIRDLWPDAIIDRYDTNVWRFVVVIVVLFLFLL